MSMTPSVAPGICIVCGDARLEQFLDLGRTALANQFLTEAELAVPEPMYPLRVAFCHGCGHVQLLDHVPPSVLFSTYLYMSSASSTLKAHLQDLAGIVIGRYRLGSSDLFIDIGCNDGTLLAAAKQQGVRPLGVDPAKNLAALAEGSGVERYVGFFSSETAPSIRQRWGQASAITATNTFAHVPAIRDFVQGIRAVLAPGGAFVIEAHYLLDLLDQAAFDTIYHEHVSYWALTPMRRLFREAGLEVVHVERLPVHHGQLRVFVQHAGASPVQPSVAQVLELERERGLDRIETFHAFAQRTLALKRSLTERLQELKAQGKRVAGYGAPAKGNTLIGFLELDTRSIDYIADKSPLKQGRFTPGAHIPVVGPERLLQDQPDYVLLLAWNFTEEVLKQQAEYRRRGGRFILPVPEVKLV